MKNLCIFLLQVSLLITTNVAMGSQAVLKTYADIAEAVYEDSLDTAKVLKSAVNQFINNPTEYNHQNAKDAWLAARVPYQQSEVYRFGNAVVDDWEGKVNAWPLDEGLIDYVDASSYGRQSDENENYVSNVIANKSIKINGKNVSISRITKQLIAEQLHEIGGVEANVATGYHAIEFLLWGQDLNGTASGSGKRPASDFSRSNCTNGNCDRRIQYLRAATNLLIDDLEEMASKWRMNGSARNELMNGGTKRGLTAMVTGLGSLSYGELAGERIQLGLMLHDPEEEHDCFSDNTHNSHYYDLIGMINVYTGRYVGVNGRMVSGVGLGDLVKQKNSSLHNEMMSKLSATLLSMNHMKKTAEAGKSYDQMLASGDSHGNKIIQDVVDHLKDQTVSIEKLVAALNLKTIEFEGSDSLDDPGKVFE
jgi:putative iron-regulated protein